MDGEEGRGGKSRGSQPVPVVGQALVQTEARRTGSTAVHQRLAARPQVVAPAGLPGARSERQVHQGPGTSVRRESRILAPGGGSQPRLLVSRVRAEVQTLVVRRRRWAAPRLQGRQRGGRHEVEVTSGPGPGQLQRGGTASAASHVSPLPAHGRTEQQPGTPQLGTDQQPPQPVGQQPAGQPAPALGGRHLEIADVDRLQPANPTGHLLAHPHHVAQDGVTGRGQSEVRLADAGEEGVIVGTVIDGELLRPRRVGDGRLQIAKSRDEWAGIRGLDVDHSQGAHDRTPTSMRS